MNAPNLAALEFAVERTVVIRAPRASVFRFFTDSARFASWWGAGSTIESRPGGAVHIRYPEGTVASGRVLEIEPPGRIVFTYGYEGPEPLIPPGGSRVTVTLADSPEGTLVELRHEVPTAAVRDAHVQGWRYQLALFANVAARDAHAGLALTVDRFLALWSEKDEDRRRTELGAIATDNLEFHDAYSATRGREDLAAHIGAAQVHMPNLTLTRAGDVRHCQGTAITDWVVRGLDGAEHGRGSNVFELAPDGRLRRVVGFWTPPAAAPNPA